MSRLAQAREEVTGYLTDAGIRVADHGARFTPPGVILRAQEPWVTPGDTFGTITVHLDLDIVAGTALTRQGLLALESLIDKVLTAIPYPLQVGVASAGTFGDSVYLYAPTTIALDY